MRKKSSINLQLVDDEVGTEAPGVLVDLCREDGPVGRELRQRGRLRLGEQQRQARGRGGRGRRVRGRGRRQRRQRVPREGYPRRHVAELRRVRQPAQRQAVTCHRSNNFETSCYILGDT